MEVRKGNTRRVTAQHKNAVQSNTTLECRMQKSFLLNDVDTWPMDGMGFNTDQEQYTLF